MGSGTGSKMVLIVFIYYLVLFSIVPLVMMASGESTVLGLFPIFLLILLIINGILMLILKQVFFSGE